MNAPVLLDVPDQLEAHRLFLRCPRAGDGRAVHEAVVESLPELRVWGASLPWAMSEPTVEASETFCRDSHANFIKRSMLTFLAFERETGEFVVSTSLHRMNWVVPKCEVGFWCRTSKLRRGYTREAVAALLDLAFRQLKARRVEAFTDELNHASRALCISVGMQLEGVLRHERAAPSGQLRNTCVFATVR